MQCPLLVITNWAGAQVWDVASEKPVLTLQKLPDSVNGLAFSPDGRQLACAGELGRPAAMTSAAVEPSSTRRSALDRNTGIPPRRVVASS